MANTYTLISSNVLSSSAASVTFSSIPATYTDLVVRYSARTISGGTSDAPELTINGSSASDYSTTRLFGTGSSASSSRYSNFAYWYAFGTNGGGSTSDTFGSNEIYIPSYTASQNKAASQFGIFENNATAAGINALAYLYRNTAAISSLTLSFTYTSFASGSSFYLYGIKNS